MTADVRDRVIAVEIRIVIARQNAVIVSARLTLILVVTMTVVVIVIDAVEPMKKCLFVG